MRSHNPDNKEILHSNVLGYPKTHKEVEALGLGEVVGKRAADVVGFYSPSPKGELVTRINEVLEEEGKRIEIKM